MAARTLRRGGRVPGVRTVRNTLKPNTAHLTANRERAGTVVGGIFRIWLMPMEWTRARPAVRAAEGPQGVKEGPQGVEGIQVSEE